MFNTLPDRIERLNDRLANFLSYFLLGMVGISFVIVVLRYVFHLGWVWLQDLVLYLHASVFLLACTDTLLKDQHVRVDIFYQRWTEKRKAWVNLIGSALLLLPTCVLIFYQSLPYVQDSWRIFEGAKDSGGLNAVFLLKSLLLIVCLLLTTGALAQFLRSLKKITHG